MSQQTIDIGLNDNDGTGDKLRDAMRKVNANFTELYSKSIQSKTPSSSIGSSGDTAGMVAWDSSYIYVCKANYDGATHIWARASISTW